MTPTLLLVPAAAAVLALALSPVVARLAVRIGAVDVPGHRKVHTAPVPRLGGLAVVSAAMMVWGASSIVGGSPLPTELSVGLVLGLLPILAVSIVDDVRGVPAAWKLLAHTLGASLAVAYGITLNPAVHLFNLPITIGWFAAPLSVLWLVGVTNAFNLIDGLDGLSAGLALISAASMAAVFALVGQPVMAGASLALAGALAGFLPYNAYPARLFLGDSGATAIGFCLAAFALKGGSTLSSGLAVLVPVFAMGLPIADTVIAMARRLVTRLETHRGGVFTADRNHIHHRLLAIGVGHRAAVLMLYGAGLLCAGVAIASMFVAARHAALLVVSLALAGAIGVQRLGYDEFAFIRRGTILRVYEAPVVRTAMFIVFLDLALTAAAAYITAGLKLDRWQIRDVAPLVRDLVAVFGVLTPIVFWKAGMYRGAWRVAGVADLARLVGASAGATLAGTAAHQAFAPEARPLTLFLIYGLTSMVLFTASRASYVVLRNSQRVASRRGMPTLVYGTGERGVAAVQELFRDPFATFRPVGFVDDDPRTDGMLTAGLPVLGGSGDIHALLSASGARALLIAAASIPAESFERLAAACERTGTHLLRFRVQLEQLLEQPAAHPERPRAPRPAGRPRTAALDAARPAAGSSQTGLLVSQWEACRACGSTRVHRSHAKSHWERLMKLRALQRLCRCEDCGWRGWLMPLETSVAVEHPGAPALDGVDRLLDASPAPVPSPVQPSRIA